MKRPLIGALVIGALAAGLMLVGAACGGGTKLSPLAAEGEKIRAEKGCASCHTVDGGTSLGPTWKGLDGSKVKLNDGSTVVANDAYLRESILHPSAKTVDGFKAGLMETVIKQGALNDHQVDALIAYIKTLH
jgi:cytochrome c oxidase subunit II